MTDANWQKVEQELKGTYGHVELLIDGYKIDLIKVLDSEQQRLYIAVYVDSKIRGEWITSDCEIRRKFYYCSKHCALKRKDIDALKKIMGKRDFEKNKEKWSYEIYSPYFGSFRTLKSHFENSNSYIELVKIGGTAVCGIDEN